MEEATNEAPATAALGEGERLQPSNLAPSGRRPLNSLVHQDERARELVEQLVRLNPSMARLLAEMSG